MAVKTALGGYAEEPGKGWGAPQHSGGVNSIPELPLHNDPGGMGGTSMGVEDLHRLWPGNHLPRRAADMVMSQEGIDVHSPSVQNQLKQFRYADGGVHSHHLFPPK